LEIIIELEAEVVEYLLRHACTVNPPRPTTLSAGNLHLERENQLDLAEAYR